MRGQSAAKCMLGFTLCEGCSARFQIRSVSADLARDLDRLDEVFCDGLARFGGDFLAGKFFSAADAFFCPVAIAP